VSGVNVHCQRQKSQQHSVIHVCVSVVGEGVVVVVGGGST